jgi:hypothetical protein
VVIVTAFEITAPGVYDIPADVYHADPVKGGSLSSSGARKLLKTCPARFRYELDHPPAPSDAMELGTAAHRMVLGVGPDLVPIDVKDRRTKAYREAAEKARAEGKVPLLSKDYDRVQAMAAALHNHPEAAALITGKGSAEQTLVWQDEATGVMCRAMLDKQTRVAGVPVIVDYKTTSDASDKALCKSVWTYGYDMQGAFYRAGHRVLDLGDPDFLFVFQETAPPHLVRIVRLGAEEMDTGARLNRRALEMFRDCRDAGVWPGYPREIHEVSLPAWAHDRYPEELYA